MLYRCIRARLFRRVGPQKDYRPAGAVATVVAASTDARTGPIAGVSLARDTQPPICRPGAPAAGLHRVCRSRLATVALGFCTEVVYADKSLFTAGGPVWHQRDRGSAHVPAGLRHVDKTAAWSDIGYHR